MYLRRKLTSNNPKTSLLTLRLLETLMNNCGERFYSAVNDKNFIYDLGKTTRKYCSKPGIECKETAEVALDVVQAWGEAFLTKRQRYPNITDLYFELRKDGLPFKKVQFDSTRVPIFNDSFVALSGPNVNNNRTTNNKSSSNRKFSINESKPYTSNEPYRSSVEVSESADSSPPLSISDVMSALSFFVSVLRDLILAVADGDRFHRSEISEEMIENIRPMSLKMSDLIVDSLNTQSEVH
jgi:hypothetical protein